MATVEHRRRYSYVWHEMPDEVRERIHIAYTGPDNTQNADLCNNDTNTPQSKTEKVTSADGVAAPPSQPEEPMQNGDHPPETEAEPQPEQESEEPAMQMGEPKDEEPKEGHVDAVEQPKTIGSAKAGKTRYTIRFRGAKWGTVLKKKRAGLEAAFKKDVVEATGLNEKHIEKLQFRFTDVMVANLTVRHQNDAEKMAEFHATLQSYNFPCTTALYTRI
ncbi:hypothetical protein DQ04_06731000 [Trypanosoma grayi]|uniref:hypothetical protein n=1 Tax=Trypanosoma grayi TaxID=71804 RepID=UPI0004F42827|nr:hypothetical protein DQ04_06731000 [Trypanosoma grayi]KEG08643.1 hypothetical protein DQ04_06731000 [Trypanosoma grayi]